MANFESAFNLLIANEGNYSVTPGDNGGETYKGISRVFHPQWEGWPLVDQWRNRPGFPGNLEQDPRLQQAIRDFYYTRFWLLICGNLIQEQATANTIFDFAVNAGTGQSARLAQRAVGVSEDGVIGQQTIKALNECPAEKFSLMFALMKIRFYLQVCYRDASQKKFFFGWVNRSVKNLP